MSKRTSTPLSSNRASRSAAIVQSCFLNQRDRLRCGLNTLVMTEAEVVQIVREHLESLFPKVCPTCHLRSGQENA